MDKDKATRNLYDEALARFRQDAADRHSNPKDAELLAEFLRERASPEETKKAAELLQSDAGKKYGARKMGDVEIPESWIANIMSNIENFVAAGDFLTKNAPESVGMAWYAVKLTLTAIHSNYDLYTFFGSGLSDISEIMIIVRHYDRLYDERSKPQWKPSPLVEKLFQDVISAYAAVLDFSFAIKRHLTAGSLTRIKHGFKDFFGLSKAKFEDKLNTVATLKKKILEASQGAFQDKTLTQLHSVSVVLAGIEGSVRHIQSFQDTQKKLHEDAMLKFDLLLRGLDDIKASTKRKSQWDYAVQDFQTFQETLSPLGGSFKVLGDTIDAIYPGTCQWVFEESRYTMWADAADDALLCITGPEGSGKSYVVASITDRVTRASDATTTLLYVTCSSSTAGATLGAGSQSYTADSICRTLLSQLYDLAVQPGEEHVGLLEACNAVFKKAKAKNNALPAHMRADSDGLPEFADGFAQLAALLKKNIVLVLDGLDRNALDDKNQEELLRKTRALLAAISDVPDITLHLLIGCASASKFFNDLDLAPDEYINVEDSNAPDIDLVLTHALKDIPGLSSGEQATAKTAILEKARARFLYVRDTAIPFMREPFQRPLATRLEALPDGAADVYSKALGKMSGNYLDLLRTALTWTVLAPEFPGLPVAREVMDAFQGTYDVAETDEEIGEEEEEVEAEFPLTSRLEIEQLRAATDPFLRLFPATDGKVWIVESDALAVAEYFVKSTEEVQKQDEAEHEHLCVRCGSTRAAGRPVYVDRKEGHLDMALTCLRHLNHRGFQRRAGLLGGGEDSDDESGEEDGSEAGDEEEGGEAGEGEGEEGEDVEDAEEEKDEDGEDGEENDKVEGSQKGEVEGDDPANQDAQSEAKSTSSNHAINEALEEVDEGYATEDSIDDEDMTKPHMYDKMDELLASPADDSDDESSTRVRYELQYWPWHIRNAEALWPEEERKDNEKWKALMAELDKLVFDTPDVFVAWQDKFPEPEDEYELFQLATGPHKPLHVAAYLGLTSWAKHLLERGEELNGLSEGYSPLQAAACSGGPLATMELLLKAGADVNAENGTNCNAFHQWMIRGEVTVEGVQMLLDHGADPRITSSREHYNGLQYFSTRGEDPAVLELLLAHGADINALHPEDGWKLPALHVLLMRREVPGPLLEAFVKNNADTNSENAASARPLQMVCTNGQLENLKILLQSKVLEIDDPDLHGTTAVHEAAFSGFNKCVSVLLEHGADPDVPDKLNRTALHTAARRGHVETVRVLLKYSKQPNLLDKHGWSPLFCACLGKEEATALLILDALIALNLPLAEINPLTRSSRTVLRQATDRGFTTVVTRLLALATPDTLPALALNTPDTKNLMAPLHRAAMHGHLPIVHSLLSASADPSLRDARSRTPLSLAHSQWSISTKNPSYEPILSQLITASPPAAVADADLAAVCAANGSVPLLEQLWAAGADLSRPDKFGWTPADLARHFARADALAFLTRQAAWAKMLPTRWDDTWPGANAIAAGSVTDGGRVVKHTSGKRVCVSAERPLPPGLGGYYFEVTLLPLEGGDDDDDDDDNDQTAVEYPEMAIGFCTLGGAAVEFPGWWVSPESSTTAQSWGYHSDTGVIYDSTEEREGDEMIEDRRYRVGDTVGCGVDLGKGEMWFTRNGVRLDEVVTGVDGRLFPVVGLNEGVRFVTNFGGGEGAFRWVPGVEEKEGEEEETEGEGVEGDEKGVEEGVEGLVEGMAAVRLSSEVPGDKMDVVVTVSSVKVAVEAH